MKKVFAWGAMAPTALVSVAGVVVRKPGDYTLSFRLLRVTSNTPGSRPVFAMLATAIVIIVALLNGVFKSRRITGQGVGPGEVQRNCRGGVGRLVRQYILVLA